MRQAQKRNRLLATNNLLLNSYFLFLSWHILLRIHLPECFVYIFSYQKILFCCCLLFNKGHVVQLWSETVVVRRGWYMTWMIYHGHMIIGDECGPHFLTFVLWLRETPGKTSTRKLTRPGIEPGPAAWEVTILSLDDSGGQIFFCIETHFLQVLLTTCFLHN